MGHHLDKYLTRQKWQKIAQAENKSYYQNGAEQKRERTPGQRMEARGVPDKQ